METSAPTEPLADRARAAYHATALEAAAEAERMAAVESERMIARTNAIVGERFGDDFDVPTEAVLLEGRPALIVRLAGTRLAVDPIFPTAVRGLIACPACVAPDCRTVDLMDELADLGRLLAAPATFELLGHEGIRGGVCNGRTETAPQRVMQPWRVLYAGNADGIEEALNELDAEGYEPTVKYDSDGYSLVIGRATRIVDDAF